MTSEQQARELINTYLIILKEEDTNELNCPVIAKRCALIAVSKILDLFKDDYRHSFWEEVQEEINEL